MRPRNLSPLLLTFALSLAPHGIAKEEGNRISLLEESPAQPGKYHVRDLGGIPGALRVSVAPLGGHILVLTSAGQVWAWGDNSAGQLGTGDTKPVEGWRLISELNEVAAIAAGAQHSMALRRDGAVWTWGANAMGQLGDGTLVPHLKPALVPNLSRVVSIAAGPLSSAALKDDGAVWLFGSNWDGVVPGDARRMLTEPVRLPGLHLEGEIQFRQAHVFARQTDVHLPWPGPTGRVRSVALDSREIQIFESGRDMFRHSVSSNVVDIASGWAAVWIEVMLDLSPRVRHEFRHSWPGSDFALDSLVTV